MTRFLFTWSEIPQQFWAEAACMTDHLRNLLPAGQDDISPNELWDGNKPNNSQIQKFGFVVHAHIPSENRAKLDRVSFQGIFIGFHSNQQAQIYNQQFPDHFIPFRKLLRILKTHEKIERLCT